MIELELKIPGKIEAIQLTEANIDEVDSWLSSRKVIHSRLRKSAISIDSSTGSKTIVIPDDWIIITAYNIIDGYSMTFANVMSEFEKNKRYNLIT